MNIAVMGANGRAGTEFVDQALKAGHTVRGGVRNIQNLTSRPGLTPVTCDTTKLEDVDKLIAGADAVVCLIGHVKHSPATLQTDSTRNAVAAMAERGLTRFISLTGTGVRFPGDKITATDHFLNLSISLIDPARVKDGIDHVEVLKQSNLEWSVIRVLKLQNTKPRPFTLTQHGPTKVFVSRHEVASSILTLLTNRSFIRQAPIISPKP